MARLQLLLLTLFVAGLIATIAVGRRFSRYPLATSEAKYGIVSLEVAGSASRAREIIESWRAERLLEHARPNIDLDSRLFIPCYTLTLVAGCAWAAGAFRGRWLALGVLLAALQPLAAGLDYIENTALIRVFDALRDPGAGRDPGRWPAVAALCAGPKFVLVLAGAVYCIAGIAAYLLRRSAKPERGLDAL